MYQKIKGQILLNLGIILVVMGMYLFLMPNKLAIGGANGLAIVINKLLLPGVPVGIIMVIINVILFITAFSVIGKGFGIKTIYASFAVSLLIFLLERFVPITSPFTDDLLLEMISGIVISGIGMGMVFNQNASTGGTDISAKILNKFFHLDLGKGVFVSDMAVTVLAGFAFGLKLSMYAALGVLINAFIIDYIIEGFNLRKEVTIISSKFEEIKKYIIEDLERGFTIYYGEGGYSGEKRLIIVVIISRREFVKFRAFVNEIDPVAFLTIKNTHEVYGDGFRKL